MQSKIIFHFMSKHLRTNLANSYYTKIMLFYADRKTPNPNITTTYQWSLSVCRNAERPSIISSMTTVRTAKGAKTKNARTPEKYPKFIVNGILMTMLHSTSDNSAHTNTIHCIGMTGAAKGQRLSPTKHKILCKRF